jgi:hypothetical protein
MQMRKIYEYQVVRYFPNELSDEFINVGVMLNGAVQKERIISEDEAKHLYCSVLMGENKKFYAMVEYLNKLVDDKKLRDPYQYFHNFSFSEVKVLASSDSEETIFDELFETYIGYKLQSEEKLDRRFQLIQDSYKIVKQEFSNHIKIHRSDRFDLEIVSIKKRKIYHSNVGSIGNKHDVLKMTWDAPLHQPKNEKYHFLDIAKVVKENDAREKLALLNIDIYNYSTDQEIHLYLEKIAV